MGTLTGIKGLFEKEHSRWVGRWNGGGGGGLEWGSTCIYLKLNKGGTTKLNHYSTDLYV